VAFVSLQSEATRMEYTIYTDGSAFGMNDGDGATKDTPAGWGFVVIEGPTGLNHDDGEEYFSNFGRVITDTGHLFTTLSNGLSPQTRRVSLFTVTLSTL
jgi:ribonuclease HI